MNRSLTRCLTIGVEVFAALLVLAASPMLAAPRRLLLLDDRGTKIISPVKVCFYRGLETICLEQPPYNVPPAMQDFESVTAEGAEHGPFQITRAELPRGKTDPEVRVPRKATLVIRGLPADRLTLSLYPRGDEDFRKPAFRFEGVTPAGLRIPAQGFVVALSTGRNAPDLQLLAAKPGATYTLSYHPRSGWSLLFRSVGKGRAPVGRATGVLLSASTAGKERELSRTTTERDGLGVLTGVSEPYATLAVSGAGYLKQSVPGLTAARGAFAFREVALERGGIVSAVVTLEDAPATGSACQLVSTQMKRAPTARLPTSDVLADVRVSESGKCTTSRMPHGDYIFRVIPKGSSNSDDQMITLLEDQTLELQVKLRRFPVSGEVRRGNKPEVGGLVLITNDADFPAFPAGRSAPPEPLKAETDQEGHYSGSVWRTGKYTFTVSSKAIVSGGSKSVDVGYDGAVVDFELNESDISGVVVDQKDEPVPNAWVTLVVRIPQVGWDNRYGAADESGHFAFPFEEGGSVGLEAGKDGYKNAERVSLEISPGEVIPPQKIVLTRLDRIEGHVVWSNGGPAAGVTVATYDGTPARQPIAAGTALTEPDGHFSVAQAPGASTRVFAMGQGCPLLVADVVNDAEEKRLVCGAISSGLEITMKKPDGTPVQDERIHLRWNGVLIPRAVLTSHQALLGMQDSTDGAGRLTIVALPPGTYDVFLQSGSSESMISEGLTLGFVSTVTLAPMETAELEVRVE